jgi:LCP family protein required for cell wall assembly
MSGPADDGLDGRLPLPPELSPRGRQKGRKPRKRTRAASWIRVASWLAVGTSVLVLGLSGAAFAYYMHLKGNIHSIPLLITGKRPAVAEDGAENILIVGDDDRTGLSAAELHLLGTTEDGGSDNTDTIIILHLAPNNGPATLVSIPRDSFVPIPGHGTFKINSAYADGEAAEKGGGPALLIKTIENLSGLHIDHFISVSEGQFVNISDAIGGVQVCVENPSLEGVDDEGVEVPAEYVHGAYDTKYDGLELKPGVQTISGATALKFVRQRHDLPEGDIDRIHRQQRFITAVEQKAETSRNPATINQVLETATKSLTVDNGLKSGLALFDLADRLHALKPDQIRFTTVPVSNINASTTINGQNVDYVELDMTKLKTFFANLAAERDPNAPATPTPSPTLNVTPATPADTTLTVGNGSGISHAAARTQASLESYGFHVTFIATVSITSATTIRYNPADIAQAAELARSVSGAALTADGAQPAGTLELTIGTGFSGVHAPTAVTSSPPPTPSPSATSTANDGTTSAANLDQGQSIDGIPCGP